jgi:hypothetical protein
VEEISGGGGENLYQQSAEFFFNPGNTDDTWVNLNSKKAILKLQVTGFTHLQRFKEKKKWIGQHAR